MGLDIFGQEGSRIINALDFLYIFPKYINFLAIKKNNLQLIINCFDLKNFIIFLYNSTIFYFRYINDLAVIDYPEKINRFKLVYLLTSFISNIKLFVTIFVKTFQKVSSLKFMYNSINWLEREAWDMYGIDFYNNYDLRRILTDYNFKGNPLRKDFPLSGFFELSYLEKFAAPIYKKIELMQELRFFVMNNDWIDWDAY